MAQPVYRFIMNSHVYNYPICVFDKKKTDDRLSLTNNYLEYVSSTLPKDKSLTGTPTICAAFEARRRLIQHHQLPPLRYILEKIPSMPLKVIAFSLCATKNVVPSVPQNFFLVLFHATLLLSGMWRENLALLPPFHVPIGGRRHNRQGCDAKGVENGEARGGATTSSVEVDRSDRGHQREAQSQPNPCGSESGKSWWQRAVGAKSRGARSRQMQERWSTTLDPPLFPCSRCRCRPHPRLSLPLWPLLVRCPSLFLATAVRIQIASLFLENTWTLMSSRRWLGHEEGHRRGARVAGPEFRWWCPVDVPRERVEERLLEVSTNDFLCAHLSTAWLEQTRRLGQEAIFATTKKQAGLRSLTVTPTNGGDESGMTWMKIETQ